MFIDVRRKDYPPMVAKNRNGDVMYTIPARHECRYIHNGKEIAHYDSQDDCLYLRTDCIGSDFKKSEYDRALSCELKDAYKYLFDMLGIDRNSKISEYSCC